MSQLKAAAGSKITLLLIASFLLSLALLLPMAHPANALVCSNGCYPSPITTYYTDSTYSTKLCSTNACLDVTSCSTPNPTPYHRTTYVCCCS